MKIDRRILVTVLIFCLVGVTALAANGRFDDPEKWGPIWESEERWEWQKPMALMFFLGIEDREVVADIGAGTGIFTQLMSAFVGPLGKVYAVDVEPAMLAHIEARDDVAYDNVETVLASPRDPKLPEAACDLILIVNTWHHIDKRVAYAKGLATRLSSRGRIAIVDYRAIELPVGPPVDHKLSREAVIGEFEKAGFELNNESVAFPYQYALVFRVAGELERVDLNELTYD